MDLVFGELDGKYYLRVGKDVWLLNEDWSVCERQPFVLDFLQDCKVGTVCLDQGYLYCTETTLYFVTLPERVVCLIHTFEEGTTIVGFHEKQTQDHVDIVFLTKSSTFNCYMLVEMEIHLSQTNVQCKSCTKLFNSEIDFQYVFTDTHELAILTDAYSLILYSHGKIEVCAVDKAFTFPDRRACQLNLRQVAEGQYEVRAFMRPQRKIYKATITFDSRPSEVAAFVCEVEDTKDMCLLRYFGNGHNAIVAYNNNVFKMVNTSDLEIVDSVAPFNCQLHPKDTLVDTVCVDFGKPSDIQIISAYYDDYYNPYLTIADGYNPGYIKLDTPELYDQPDAIIDFWPTKALGLVVQTKDGIYAGDRKLDIDYDVYDITNEGYIVEDTGKIQSITPSITHRSLKKDVVQSYVIHKDVNVIERIEVDVSGGLIEKETRAVQGLDLECTIIKDEFNTYYYRGNTLYVIGERATEGSEIAKLPSMTRIYDAIMGTPAGSRILISDVMGCLYLYDFSTDQVLKKLFSKNNKPFTLVPIDIQATYVLAYNSEETIFIDILKDVMFFINMKFGCQDVKSRRDVEAGELWYIDSNKGNSIGRIDLKMEDNFLESSPLSIMEMSEKKRIDISTIPESIIHMSDKLQSFVVLANKFQNRVNLSLINLETGQYKANTKVTANEKVIFCKLFPLKSLTPEFEPFEMYNFKNLFLVQRTTSKDTVLYLFELIMKENKLKRHSSITLKKPITDIRVSPDKIDTYLFQDLQKSFKVIFNKDGSIVIDEISHETTETLENNDFHNIPIISGNLDTAYLRSNVLTIPSACRQVVYSEIFCNRGWTYGNYGSGNASNSQMVRSVEFTIGLTEDSKHLQICVKDGDYSTFAELDSICKIDSIKSINPYSAIPLCYSYMDNGQCPFLIIFNDGTFGMLEVIENRDDLWRGVIEDIAGSTGVKSEDENYYFKIKKIQKPLKPSI